MFFNKIKRFFHFTGGITKDVIKQEQIQKKLKAKISKKFSINSSRLADELGRREKTPTKLMTCMIEMCLTVTFK